ncbi:MAG: EF-P beta-lysylation protein EpmB [Gammaproteobacteria bacterium]|nr:EF-P beta-lysylation protein EpmB [Gammaproteobacteria bacterium]
MISKTAQSWQHPVSWQTALAQAIRDPAELLQRLSLPLDLLPAAQAAARLFPLRVPHSYLQRIQPGDPDDPLLRQVLPLAEECALTDEGVADPVGDLNAMASPGLLHKYHGRALLVTTGACAIHCRYCFRRHFPYASSNPLHQHREATLAYLREHTQLNELILSGGDPLSLPDSQLAAWVRECESLPHLQILRLHTRLPVVLPERVDDALCQWLSATRFRTVIVLHINHPREIDTTVGRAIQALRDSGVTLLNQSVLLRGVNDSVATLAELSQTLFAHGVLPYYLHQFDPVQGAMHFAVPLGEGQAMVAALRTRLPGYLVPKYVQEIPGMAAKYPV